MIACAICEMENYKLQSMVEGLLKNMGEQRGAHTHPQLRRLAISYNSKDNRQARIELLFEELRKDLLRETGVDLFQVEKIVARRSCEPWSIVRKCSVVAAVVLLLYAGVTDTVAARNLGPIIAESLKMEQASAKIGAFLAVTSYLMHIPLYIIFGLEVGNEIGMHVEGLQCCGKENKSGFYKTQSASDWIIKAAGFGLSVGFVLTKSGFSWR